MEANGVDELSVPETIQGKVTGIIKPPPDLRAIVDKTAQFVARNGRSFERKIAGETASGKFSFIKPSDPYHGYYEFKVLEFMEKQGLKRGENGLQIYVMCEIPNNVIQIEAFAELVAIACFE